MQQSIHMKDKDLFSMMALKCLNLLVHHPPEVVEKKGYGGGKWTCLGRVFGANPVCVVWKPAVQFTGQHRQLDPLSNI